MPGQNGARGSYAERKRERELAAMMQAARSRQATGKVAAPPPPPLASSVKKVRRTAGEKRPPSQAVGPPVRVPEYLKTHVETRQKNGALVLTPKPAKKTSQLEKYRNRGQR